MIKYISLSSTLMILLLQMQRAICALDDTFSIELDVDTTITSGVSKQEYPFLINCISDLKILKNGEHNCGVVADVLLEHTLADRPKRTALHRAFFYYIFDYFGEIKIGDEYDAIYYSHAIDGATSPGSIFLKEFVPGYYARPYFLSPGDSSTATKVLWISPKISGWTLTASYTPNFNRYHCCSKKGRLSPYKNIFAYSLSYENGTADEWRYRASIGAYYGRAGEKIYKNIGSYIFGAGLGYNIIDIDINYINNLFYSNLIGGSAIKYLVTCNCNKLKLFVGGARTIRYKKNWLQKVGGAYRVNDSLTFSCEYRIIKTYTTTLKKLGDKQHMFIAELQIKI